MNEESFDHLFTEIAFGGFTRQQTLRLISELFSQLADKEPSDD